MAHAAPRKESRRRCGVRRARSSRGQGGAWRGGTRRGEAAGGRAWQPGSRPELLAAVEGPRVLWREHHQHKVIRIALEPLAALGRASAVATAATAATAARARAAASAAASSAASAASASAASVCLSSRLLATTAALRAAVCRRCGDRLLDRVAHKLELTRRTRGRQPTCARGVLGQLNDGAAHLTDRLDDAALGADDLAHVLARDLDLHLPGLLGILREHLLE